MCSRPQRTQKHAQDENLARAYKLVRRLNLCETLNGNARWEMMGCQDRRTCKTLKSTGLVQEEEL